VWWLVTIGAAETRIVSPVVLPSPAEVFGSFGSLLNERALIQSIAATLKRVLLGFGLAILVGVPLGIAAGSWRVFEATGAPLALPDIYNSLRHLFGMAFGYIMLAELINANYGLGYLLMTSQRRGLSEHIILILMVIGLLAFAIDRLLYFFQRGLFPYRPADE